MSEEFKKEYFDRLKRTKAAINELGKLLASVVSQVNMRSDFYTKQREVLRELDEFATAVHRRSEEVGDSAKRIIDDFKEVRAKRIAHTPSQGFWDHVDNSAPIPIDNKRIQELTKVSNHWMNTYSHLPNSLIHVLTAMEIAHPEVDLSPVFKWWQTWTWKCNRIRFVAAVERRQKQTAYAENTRLRAKIKALEKELEGFNALKRSLKKIDLHVQ